MTSPKEVGFVIIGCGYMGGNGILAFTKLVNSLQLDNVELKIVLIVEPKHQTYQIVRDYCERTLSFTPESVEEISLAFPRLRLLASEGLPIIIFDASFPQHHFGHLVEIHKAALPNLYYIGEKPLFVDPAQVRDASYLNKEFPFFCDLIESENPVFHSVRSYINKHKLHIKSMSFWRAGSSGIKKMIGSERAGVQGGALLDKSPHDFSISINLLGPEGVQGRLVPATPTIHYLIPARECLEDEDDRRIITTSGTALGLETDLQTRSHLPADSLISLSVEWFSPNSMSGVQSKYLFSWIGLTDHPKEQEFIQKLESLGYSTDEYVLEYKENGPHTPQHPLLLHNAPKEESHNYEGTIQEVRVGIIECNGGVIVCSFLTKGDRGAVQRFAYWHPNGAQSRQSIEEQAGGKELKGDELAQVFKRVVYYALRNEPASFIGRHVALETHRWMLAAQNAAITNLREDSFEQIFSESLKIIKGKVRKL